MRSAPWKSGRTSGFSIRQVFQASTPLSRMLRCSVLAIRQYSLYNAGGQRGHPGAGDDASRHDSFQVTESAQVWNRPDNEPVSGGGSGRVGDPGMVLGPGSRAQPHP